MFIIGKEINISWFSVGCVTTTTIPALKKVDNLKAHEKKKIEIFDILVILCSERPIEYSKEYI